MNAEEFSLHPAADRRIAVAGGCGGIGRRLVSALFAHGCRVAVIDMPASLKEYPPPDPVLAASADATQEEQVMAAAAEVGAAFGALDGFVNLCGFTRGRTPIADLDLAQWQTLIDGNLTAAFTLSRAMLPLLAGGRDASMVHMASSLAVKASPGYAAYSAAKAGILSLTRMLAAENAPDIRVNAVAPSAVRTRFIEGGTGRQPSGDGPLLDLDAYGRSLPLGRVAEPDDVVGPILFLLGPGSRYMTGQTLHINGGLYQP